MTSPTRRRRRYAQGMPPVPPMPGPPGMGGPPLGMPPGMPGAMPMAAPAGPPPRQEINGPLDSLAKLLYDWNIEDKVGTDEADSPEELALKVWQDYGGNIRGQAEPGHIGERAPSEAHADPTIQDKERDATDNARWKRLPKGKLLTDITNLDDLSRSVGGLLFGTIKNEAKQQGAGGAPGGPPGGPPPPGGGGPPPPGAPPGGAPSPPGGAPPMPMAAIRTRLRLAALLDAEGCYSQADRLDQTLRTRL